LLAQVLRVVNPAIGAGAAGPSNGEHEPAPAGPDGGPGPGGPGGESGPGRGGGPGDAAGRAPGAAAQPGGAAGQAALAAVAAISASEARALIELVAARGIAQGELGGLLGLEKSTVSRLAAGLERKGWVRRGRDEGNQRYVRLYLTPQGQAVAARVLNAWQSRQQRILAALTADERAGLEAGLRGLVRGLAAERVTAEPGAGRAGQAPPGQASPGQAPPGQADG
jgi:DNA-binding MarR family transcriptional regulator